jgi:hypothetical protein
MKLVSRAAPALLALLAFAAAAGAQSIPRSPVEFSPTISIFFLEDLVPFADDPSTNQCIEMVKRASSFNSRRLNMMCAPRLRPCCHAATPVAPPATTTTTTRQ